MVMGGEIPRDLDEMTWSQVQSVVAEIEGQLRRTDDLETRKTLQARLAEARQAIVDIEAGWDDDGDMLSDRSDVGSAHPFDDDDDDGEISSIDALLAELLADEAEPEPDGHQSDVLEAAITTARTRTGNRATGTATMAATSPSPRQGSPHPAAAGGAFDPGSKPVAPEPSAGRFDTPLLVVGVFALAALAGTLGVLLVGWRGGSETAPVLTENSAEAAGMDELREVLVIIGADDLELQWDGSVLRISGTVMSDEQLQIVRETAATLVDQAELDTGDVIIDAVSLPVSESSSASLATSASMAESDRVEPKLQRDLDRLLGSTPIIFESGASELGELDRRILNSVVVLLRSTPDARVIIVGHADEPGTSGTTVDLASDRADAVRDYLVGRGIEADALTAEAKGTPNPSGISSAIELVVAAGGGATP